MYWLKDGINGVSKGDIGSGRTGITAHFANGTNMTEANISINSNLSYGNGTNIVGTYILKSVFIHELGHVLGLSDDLNNKDSVMYVSYTGKLNLGSQDINDLNYLY